ncbi:MAG: hypothetical protein HQK79_15755 [Desulfobacterales bacterium]|nr:hypothetical protein [Desulfobacterales bacterium]
MKTIIVYISGALGDIILSTPALSVIRYAFIDYHIHIIGTSYLYELYPYLFDSFTNINSRFVAKLFSDEAMCAIKEHSIWKDAETIIIFERSGSNLSQYIKKLNLIVINASFKDCKFHYSNFLYFETIRALKVSCQLNIPYPVSTKPDIYVEKPFAIIHPGSGSKKKNASCEIIKKECIQKQGVQKWNWIVLSGESDIESVNSFLRIWKMPKTKHIHLPKLTEIAWLMSNAEYYIGNDSGISHLAGVSGVQGTVFFVTTDPVIWKPIGESILVK